MGDNAVVSLVVSGKMEIRPVFFQEIPFFDFLEER